MPGSGYLGGVPLGIDEPAQTAPEAPAVITAPVISEAEAEVERIPPAEPPLVPPSPPLPPSGPSTFAERLIEKMTPWL